MRALVRNKGETIIESDGLNVDWNTGHPFTDQKYFGGPYILVNNYVPEDPADDFVLDGPAPAAASEASQDPAADTIVIDGVVYRRA